MHHHDIMKTTAKAYLRNQEPFIQEAVYHIFPDLKLGRIFPAVYFVKTNLTEDRVQVLFSEKEFSKLTGDSPNILKKSNIDCYMGRSGATNI